MLDNFKHLTDGHAQHRPLTVLLGIQLFSCMGALETWKEVIPVRMRKEDLFPQLCRWRCGGMAVPHITAACGAFYPCVKNRQESGNKILLKVTQPPMDTSEDFQKLHSAHVGTSAHL